MISGVAIQTSPKPNHEDLMITGDNLKKSAAVQKDLLLLEALHLKTELRSRPEGVDLGNGGSHSR